MRRIRTEKGAHFQTHRLGDERGHGVADDAELMGAGDGEPKPVREALDARGFARGERAVLRRVDEHEAVLAQVGDDGAARLAAALAGVAILEMLLGIRPLKDHPAPHRLGGVFALVEQGEVAQVAMGGESPGFSHFKNSEKIVPRSRTELRYRVPSPPPIVKAILLTTACGNWRQIADRRTEIRAGSSTFRRTEVGRKIAGQIASHAND